MLQTPITKETCEQLSFDIQERYHETSNYDWIAEKGMVVVRCLGDEITVRLRIGGGSIILDHIVCVYQLRNLYELLHNEIL